MEINAANIKLKEVLTEIFLTRLPVLQAANYFYFHSYSATDDVSSAPGLVVYYRIKQLDLDGRGLIRKYLL